MALANSLQRAPVTRAWVIRAHLSGFKSRGVYQNGVVRYIDGYSSFT